ncbi:MAG: TIGR00341 family protein [Planctomycetota bacterium]
MPLRFMQIFIPEGSGEKSDALLEGREVLGQWHDTHKDQTVLHLLVPAEETEPIMDEFEEEFSGVEGFHVVLFSVEAVLPRPEANRKEEGIAAELVRQGNNSDRISREELYTEVSEGIGVTRVFVGMTVLSAIVAAVGLMRDDVAVIIGAMVIAPLLGPNVATSLAITLGDMGLLRRALLTSVVGIVSTLLLAVLIGAVFTVDPEVPAIAARTKVGVGDILLALAAGAAGTLAFTRGLSGAVIGVMVAVAILPPLVNAGILLGAGMASLALGALLLSGANVICIILAGILTFMAQGVRPRNWWETERARSASRNAALLLTILVALLALLLLLSGRGMSLEAFRWI